MKDTADFLPGMERVKSRFLEILHDRQKSIATHAIGAWEGETSDDINEHLSSAQKILHQISGTAGSLGFATLGDAASFCENAILVHLASPAAQEATCPGDLIVQLDQFVVDCCALLETAEDSAEFI